MPRKRKTGGTGGPATKSNKPGWVDWWHCEAREVLLNDLGPGGLLYGDDCDQIHPETLFGFYKVFYEDTFKGIVYEQFEKRLADHRKQVGIKRNMAKRDEIALRNDRELFPRQKKNGKGQLVFDLHPAKMLLREDIKNKKHRKYKPSQLRCTRKEYKEFSKEIFKYRVKQEIRRDRYLRYLENKRQEKKKSNDQAKDDFGPNKKKRSTR